MTGTLPDERNYIPPTMRGRQFAAPQQAPLELPAEETPEGVESLKIEKNTKGHNWSYRIVKKLGMTWDQVLATSDNLEIALQRRFGQ